MHRFVHDPLSSRVVFGWGALDRLADEVGRLGIARALVVSTPGQRTLADDIRRRLGGLCAGLHAHAAMHVPVEIARAGVVAAKAATADGLVAIGGGSAIGLGKAIALETGLPLLAVPTTYSGSEMTPVWGLTENRVKRTGRDPRVLPRAVLYDPSLTVVLPPGVSATSGMNAIAHAVEALYAEDANPAVSVLAEDGIRALAASLPAIVAAPADPEARSEALYGAWLCGGALGAVGMALHHKLCHTLGGACDLPHAETHTVILPHAVAYNSEAAPDAMKRIARALGADDAATGLAALARRIGAPTSLRAIGMRAEDLDRAADLATRNPYYNPRPVTEDGIRKLLDDAFHGRPPGAARL